MSEYIPALPPHLGERTRTLNPAPRRDGRYVLYWMHHAMRAEENPALDVALVLADRHKLPVLVYQGLAGRHPYNSDRHHLFILQGARELAGALGRRGIRYLFHLPETRSCGSPLPALAGDAAEIVIEEMPVPPFTRWHPVVARRSGCPVHAVDTRCLVPMREVGRPFDRALRFRAAVQEEYAARIDRPWPGVAVQSRDVAELDVGGFGDLESRDDDDLLARIARCDIDHSVWPVFETPGGSAAAKERWDGFRREGLATYHRKRNDAAVEPPAGVSRLSPYLHYGQISPFALAREASAQGGPGAEKFLDELLVWRELAHNFCFHHAELESQAALPAWARETLAEHAGDPRAALLSWETLARGRTGDELWDLAQHSLLRHGELHNNLRMTWAKAVLGWTRDAGQALAMLIDLNHRFALDGNDPNSYGGLLWALGQFDRPFEPEKPVFGRVRSRDTKAHAHRLDMDRYRRRIGRAAGTVALHVAIVGAGIAGLTAARQLSDAGHRVSVFEKGRGPGGRSATRHRAETSFDHGAQYFSVRDEAFRRYVRAWREDGIVAPWPRRPVRIRTDRGSAELARDERFVGCPGMNAVAKHLAADIDVRSEARIESIGFTEGLWQLYVDGAQERSDALIVSAPAPQAAELIADVAPDLAGRAGDVEFLPCWAVMGNADRMQEPDFDAAFVEDPVLVWAAADHRKPGRNGTRAWVLHASAEWSALHLEAEAEEVGRALGRRAREILGLGLVTESIVAHRWRHARAAAPLDVGALSDDEKRLVLCGDWCIGESRIENAWRSGQAAAARMITLAGGDR